MNLDFQIPDPQIRVVERDDGRPRAKMNVGKSRSQVTRSLAFAVV